jgi:hypothetical protein
MNFGTGREHVEMDAVNVVSLFGKSTAESNDEVMMNDPLQNLIDESMIEDNEDDDIEVRSGRVVTQEQFPDQSMFTLEEQLSTLRSRMNRIRFYLGDLEDLLPR